MQKILIVDDEPNIVELLQFNLQKAGFQVSFVMDGLKANSVIQSNIPDLILLDWMLPGMEGIELCKRLRSDQATARIPIIMVSAKSEEFDRVLALEIGADDYISKPFSVRELVARVKALIRRSTLHDAPADARRVLCFDGITIDPVKVEVLVDRTLVQLTHTEFELLANLAGEPERVFNRKQLLYRVWGHDFYGDERVVDVHIRRLRAKLEEITDRQFVHTVRGVGYKFSVTRNNNN